ncbi:MAG: SPFH/Band 7/PHB domain protein [Chloroflexi bacterium]|nr:SPFH/Band 7/PHB domain protein [Chloroflexota bacterium]
MDPITSGILILFVVLFVFSVIVRSVRLTNEYERLVILFLGRYTTTRGPGLVFVLPFFEQAIKVDLRERFLEIPRQTAISKDNAPINVDFLVYYRTVNPADSVLKVDNAVRASLNVAATTLRSVIGDIVLDDVLAKREQINDVLRVKLDEVTESWGLKVTRVEIREIEPPREVQEAMNRQMTAERERRATVTRAEGERQAAIMVAEGQKEASILKAQGEKESAILRAEGERQSQLLRAQGFAASLEAISREAKDLDEHTMALQYLDTLRTMGSGPATKFVLPMEITGLMSRMSGMLTARAQEKPANSDGTGD